MSYTSIRDWALITGGGGGYKIGELRVQNYFSPPPFRMGKTLPPPPPLPCCNPSPFPEVNDQSII